MPYRYAWLFIVGLLAATTVAFRQSYLGVLFTSPIGFHIHAATSTLWMLLLLAQSWTAHRGGLRGHRLMGRATFVAVPLFAAGAMGVIHSMAVATANHDRFYALWGTRLGFIDLLAFGAFLYFVGMALRHRRNVRLHAGYMLATTTALISPVVGRVFNQVIPGMIISGPADFPVFGRSVQLGNLFAGVLALWLWRRDPKAGRPWAVALAVIVVQIAAFETIAATDAWRSTFLAFGTQPLPVLMAIGMAIGGAVVWLGWTVRYVKPKAVAVTLAG